MHEDVLVNDVFPAFQEEWKRKTDEDLIFQTSFSGSGVITNQILSGAPAEMATLSHEYDAIRLKKANKTSTDWDNYWHGGIVTTSPIVIVTRNGNPKNISDWNDLTKEGVEIVLVDPTTSGGAMWSILAIYGSVLMESETETGAKDYDKALELLRGVSDNVVSMPSSIRKGGTTFETGVGDVLVTYEDEYLLMKRQDRDYVIVVPRSTITTEHPIVVIDKNVHPNEREMINEFVDFLWSDTVQEAFASYGFRSVNEKINKNHLEFAEIKLPFTVGYLGGWEKAKKDIIDGIWTELQEGN